MSLTDIFYIILLASASGLCISLMFYLRKITKSVNDIERDVNDLSTQIRPLVASATNLSEKLVALTERAKEPVETAKDIMHDVKFRVDEILDFEEQVRKSVEGPVFKLINSLTAIANGVSTFWNTYKRK